MPNIENLPPILHIMKRTLAALSALCLPFCCVSLFAQQHPNRVSGNNLKYVLGTEVNITDSVNAYRLLYENIPQDKDFLNDPIFAIVGRNRLFYFSVGANMKVGLDYDWGNPSDDPQGLSVAGIQKANPGDTQAFQMTAQSSNIYFNIIGFPHTANSAGLFVSLALDDEPGNSYRVHADNVYFRFRGFTAGYTNSLYNDKSADPYTIDSHGPIASGSHSNILVNYQKFVSKNVRLGIGIEGPTADYSYYLPDGKGEEEVAPNLRQRVPDIPLYVTYAFNSSDHIRLSAIGRILTYRNYVENRNRDVFGWGLKLTGSATCGKSVFYGMVQGGKGISSYIQENRGLGLDLVPDMSRPGHLDAPVSWGYMLGLQRNWRSNLYSTVVYSFMRNYVGPYTNGSNGIAYADQLKYGHYALANLIWRCNRLMQFGVEYLFAQKNTFGKDRISNNRLSLQVCVSF